MVKPNGPGQSPRPARDRPWLMRTYAGHSSALASNALFRRNLAKGQTGLSVAFDLPTQTGYDADHVLARGEVGRVGVPVGHLGDMRALFDGIPLEQTNTSMTINATAMWLLALYQVVAEEQGADIAKLTGTTQNDIIKEYLSRGTYVFPPGPSVRLTTDLIAYTVARLPRWNPINVCSYHLQEAGATPVQEIAYALCTATTILDAVRDSGQVPPERMGEVVGRMSFFVNAGVRFVEEMCKMRAFSRLWDQLTRERYGIADPALRRFRYGVQVNSLGLTEEQPENNVQRIVLEMLAVVLSRDARARAIQLPAWNEALGLPRPWDQQWSLRIQQVLAYESDLLEYGDLFDGSPVVEAKTAELVSGAEAEMAVIEGLGGMVPAVESGYLKAQLVASHAARRARIESGDLKIVGVNCFQATEPSPLTANADAAVHHVDPAYEQAVLADLDRWRRHRDQAAALGRPRPAHGRRGAARRQPDRRHPGLRPGRRDHRRVGLRAAGGVRRVPGPYRACPARRRRSSDADLAAVRTAVRATAGQIGVGAAAAAAGQARPGRALQRDRADRRPGPRRGIRGDLLRHPAHPGADRGGRGGRGRGLRGAVDPVRRARRAGARGAAAAASGRRRAISRWWSAGSSRRPTPRRCAPRAWRPSSPPGTSASPPSSAASWTRYAWPTSSSRGRAARP